MLTDFFALVIHPNVRQVLSELVRRDLRSRYKVSLLGFLWSLLRPFFSLVVITAVFAFVVELETPPLYGGIGYFAFLTFGYLPWVFFSMGLAEGTQSILANSSLVKKVYCPRAVFPLTTVGAQLVNFLLALAVFLPLIWAFTAARPSLALLALPLVILLQTLLLAGLVMALSALNVLYRDVGQILEFTTLAWFYLTPVLYPVNMPIDKLAEVGLPAWLIWLNPVATLTFWYRWSCLGTIDLGSPEAAALAGSLPLGTALGACACILACLWGHAVLKRNEIKMVDEL